MPPEHQCDVGEDHCEKCGAPPTAKGEALCLIGRGRANGTAAEVGVEPLAPANGNTPGLLALRYNYDNWRIAEEGFFDQFVKQLQLGVSARDIAAALNILPKDVFVLLKKGNIDVKASTDRTG